MKTYQHSQRIARRGGTILGLMVLFLSCAMMGGADPAAQVDAARDQRDNVNGVVAEETSAIAEMAENPVEQKAEPAAQPEGVDFVDFAKEAEAEEAKLETTEVDGIRRITVALEDVSLEEAVGMFSKTAGANIIVSGEVLKGKRVTVNLHDVEWQSALRSILEINGLSLVEQVSGSNVFSIQVKLPDAPEPTVVQTFFLEYTTVNEISDSIKGMLRPNSVITLFASRNAIVIRSTEPNLREVGKLIKDLDRPGRQVLIETKIMELSDTAMKELGVRWDSLKEFGVRGGLGPFSETRTTTEDLQKEYTTDHQDYASYANVSRTFHPQSGYEQVAPVNTSAGYLPSRPGNTDFVGNEGGTIRNSPLGYDPGQESFHYDGSTDAQGTTLLDGFTRQIVREQSAILEMDSLSVILSALESLDGVSVVSNPKMIVTSGSTNAYFSVGRRDPIIESELKRGTTDSPGDTITSKLMDPTIRTSLIEGGYFKTGIDLQVIATVKTDDYIEALINPTLRRLLDFKTVGINSWPIISVKEIGTTFTLRSGQTVAIGGLTDTQDKKVTTRVPVLGRIPVLGRLFSHEETEKSQVETIIFVTLSVANPGELSTDAGIPDDARLVQKRRMQDQINRQEFDQQLKVQKEAVSKATQEKAEADAVKSQEEAEADAKAVLEKAEADAKKATDLQTGKKAKKKAGTVK